ncbi:hypothetical protein HY624_02300 [Candidatus Uhrbacteria bacterium]|nr:hypothetical protein [Candidatus Uhrbacteria bacterium]
MRHSISVQEGDNDTRTLTHDGSELCSRVRGFYLGLLSELAIRFGEPEFWTSSFMRARLTAWEIFHPEQLHTSERLNIIAAMPDVHGGEWYAAGKAAGKTDQRLIRELIADPALQRDQPFSETMVRHHAFLREREARLTVAVGHEANISFAAAGIIPHEQLGLLECEAVVFYLNAAKQIISAEKIAPRR